MKIYCHIVQEKLKVVVPEDFQPGDSLRIEPPGVRSVQQRVDLVRAVHEAQLYVGWLYGLCFLHRDGRHPCSGWRLPVLMASIAFLVDISPALAHPCTIAPHLVSHSISGLPVFPWPDAAVGTLRTGAMVSHGKMDGVGCQRAAQ